MEIFAPIEKSFDRSSIFSKKIFQELVCRVINLFFSDFFFLPLGISSLLKYRKKESEKFFNRLKNHRKFSYILNLHVSQTQRVFPQSNAFINWTINRKRANVYYQQPSELESIIEKLNRNEIPFDSIPNFIFQGKREFVGYRYPRHLRRNFEETRPFYREKSGLSPR